MRTLMKIVTLLAGQGVRAPLPQALSAPTLTPSASPTMTSDILTYAAAGTYNNADSVSANLVDLDGTVVVADIEVNDTYTVLSSDVATGLKIREVPTNAAGDGANNDSDPVYIGYQSVEVYPNPAALVADEDWWLPSTVDRTPGTGRTWMSTVAAMQSAMAADGLTTKEPRYASLIEVRWEDVETSEGVFDWTATDAAVAAVRAVGGGAGYYIFPWYSDPGQVPQWAKDNYTLTRDGTNSYYMPWDAASEMDTALNPFITALVQRYISDPYCVYIDMRSPFDDVGEWTTVAEDSGTDFYEWGLAWHKMWAAAAGHYHWKLVTMLANEAQSWQPELNEYSFALGIGSRDGLPSRMRKQSIFGYDISYSSSANPSPPPNNILYYAYGLLETHPNMRGHAITYSESTEYDYNTSDWGTTTNTHIRWLLSGIGYPMTLRRNWIAMSRSNVVTAEALMVAWAMKQMGKHLSDSPDAWVLSDVVVSESLPYNRFVEPNFLRRWLKQIRASGGTEVYDDSIGTPYYFIGTHYRCIRTDLANSQSYLYYQLDSAFAAIGTFGWIKVSYKDKSGCSFYIEYDTSAGTSVTPTVVCGGTDTYKTVTLAVPGFVPQQGLTGSADFRIVAEGADVWVEMVRVIRLPSIRFATNINSTTFSTDDAAPIASPYDGWAANDTNSSMSVSGGELLQSRRSTTNGDPRLVYATATARAGGLILKAKIKSATKASEVNNSLNALVIGIGGSATPNNETSMEGLVISHYAQVVGRTEYGGSTNLMYGAEVFLKDTYYEVAQVVVSSVGSLLFMKISGHWTLVGILRRGANANVYPAVYTLQGANRSPFELKDFLKWQRLGHLWDQAYAGSMLAQSSPGSGTLYDAVPHGIIHWDFTTPGTLTGDDWLHVRKADDGSGSAFDYWALNVNASGDVTIQRYDSGVAQGSAVTLASAAVAVSKSYALEVKLVADKIYVSLYDKAAYTWTALGSAQTDSYLTTNNGAAATPGAGTTSSLLLAYPYTSNLYAMIEAV